jgi:hypothetical protein
MDTVMRPYLPVPRSEVAILAKFGLVCKVLSNNE